MPEVALRLDELGPRPGDVAGRDLLRERVRTAIRDAIARGHLKAGQQIIEAAIADELGVSRSPVREALRQLEQHGLVFSLPNRGTFVAELNEQDVEEILLLRGALEGLAARLAADRMGRRDLRDLEALVQRMEQSAGADPDSWNAFTEADAEFHTAVVRFSAHQRLRRMWADLDPLIWLLRPRVFPPLAPVDHTVVAREHRQLMEVLAAGDPEEAQSAAWQHIMRRRDTILSRAAARHAESRRA
jgi:DNA-binding GntR family transcriptional regulator